MSWKNLIEAGKEIDTKVLNSFLNMAVTSTLQDEYYSKAEEQSKEAFSAHNKLLENSREVYAISTLLPINDIHKQFMIFNLLKNADIPKEQKNYENRVILTALKYMPTHRAIKMFTILQKNKVNNARTRWLAKQFLSKIDAFRAVKYKKWIKNIIIHNHVKPAGDMQKTFDFLFNKMKGTDYPEIFIDYNKAKKTKSYIYKLPYSVALGFKALHKIPNEEFMKKIKDQLSHSEKLRVQNVAEKAKVEIKTDLASYSPVKLLKYLRSSEKKFNFAKAFSIFDKGCKRIADGIPLKFKSMEIVLDTSASMFGSAKKKYHPISVAEACAGVLMHLSENGEKIREGLKSKLLKNPQGATDLATPILEALEKKPELLVILSDGYENMPANLTNQIINAYLVKIGKTGILHINPVFAPESKDIRKLNDKIVTMGIRDVKQLLLILLIALAELKKTKEIQKILENLRKKIMVIEVKKKKVKK